MPLSVFLTIRNSHRLMAGAIAIACMSGLAMAGPIDPSNNLSASQPANSSAESNVVAPAASDPSFFVSPPKPAVPRMDANAADTPDSIPADGGKSQPRAGEWPASNIRPSMPANVTLDRPMTHESSAHLSAEDGSSNALTMKGVAPAGTSNGHTFALNDQSTPEPGSLGVLAMGSLLLLRRSRRQTRRSAPHGQ